MGMPCSCTRGVCGFGYMQAKLLHILCFYHYLLFLLDPVWGVCGIGDSPIIQTGIG